MRKTMLATLLFIFCFVFIDNVNASSQVEIYFDKIPNTSWQIKGNVVKKTYSIPKVKALSVSTKLTNPCDSCKLGVRMYSDSDWFALGSQLKLGQEINFI